MKFSLARRTMVLFLSLATLPAFATRTHRASNAGHTRASLKHIMSKRSLRHAHKAAVIKGQRQIDPARATQIQEALIHENYLTGTPSGQWDADTETAMQKFQADHGWQTKLTPDSRALIKLGLGPNQDSQSVPTAKGTQTANSTATAAENDTLASAHAIRE